MLMRRKEELPTLAGVLFAVCAWPSLSASQQNAWVPFTAKKVTRLYLLSSSGEKFVEERTALVARNSNGSVYTGDAPDTPSIRVLRGTLIDGRTGDRYEIDYEHQCVALHRSFPRAPLQPPTGEEYQHVPPECSLGTRMISGVECIGIKERTGRGDEQTREIWVAPSLNYEAVETVLNVKETRIKIVLEDIRPGTRPDPELFRVPAGFQKVYIGPLSQTAVEELLRAPSMEPLLRVDPKYPPAALRQRIQGTVRLEARIGKDGHVERLRLVSGHPLLVHAATEAARQWVFRPALLHGKPARVVTEIDVQFQLDSDGSPLHGVA
jgi:TonB family protein